MNKARRDRMIAAGASGLLLGMFAGWLGIPWWIALIVMAIYGFFIGRIPHN